MMENQQGNSNLSTIETGVVDLPVGLLGRAIIQHLPWKKRVQVEGVCTSWREEALAYGWKDVKHLEWEERNNNLEWWWEEKDGVPLLPISWVPLLSRVGPHLTTLKVGNELDGEELLAGLVKCPKLRHLCVEWRQLTPQVLDHICSVLAPTLKSLRLNADELYDSERASALSEAICHLPALEYLRVGYWSEIKLCNSLVSLGNLRHLALHRCNISQDSFDGLAALPSFRSLSLWEAESTVKRMDFSALQRFPHLEHLCLEIGALNVGSFVEALPHLGASLKALEVQEWLRIEALKQLLPAITAHLHQLEHLELWMTAWDRNHREEMERLLESSFAYPQLKSLRSLSIWVEPVGWDWLERICLQHHQGLEYIELDCVNEVMPPLAPLCSIVRECKSLSGIKLPQRYQWDVWQVEKITEAAAMAAAAAAVVAAIGGDNEEERENCTLPTLCIAANLIQEVRIDSSSRLQFVEEDELRSQVLDKYRYGCLSEGRPPLISI